MIKKIASFLSPLIPEELAVKGLKKINPKISEYLDKSFASGISVTAALEFLRSKFKVSPANTSQVPAGGGGLRPDELAAEGNIQQSRDTSNLMRNVASKGLGTAAAITGLGAAGQGIRGLGAVLNGIGSMVEPEQQQGILQQQVNPLQEFEMNYPDIARALANTMQQGQSPQAAAGILKTSTAFGKKIKELEKLTGKNFVDYIVELFGMQQQAQAAQSQRMQPQQAQAQVQQQAQPQQGGGVDPQLLALIQGIRGSIQSMRG